MNVASFKTVGKHGYAVESSPYFPQRIACAACQHFGIAGSGKLYVIDQTPQGPQPVREFEWNDGLFDVAWSENNENIAVTGSGDGSLQVWDVAQSRGPIKVLKEHKKEVYSIHWNQTRDSASLVLTASWDQTVKLWDISHNQSLNTFTGHEHVVYSAIWAPRTPKCFATTSGDQTLRIWDTQKPYMAQIVIPAHNSEIITCDWSKYDENIVFTAGVDCLVKGWDLRNFRQPIFELKGHQYAIRRLKSSPFSATQFITSSYDFTVRTWNFQVQNTPMETIEHHTEFVCGIDYNLHIPGQIVDCSWDEMIKIYTPKSLSMNP